MEFTLEAIGQRLLEQDNRITANPIFVVKQKRVIAGVDPAFSEEFSIWKDVEESEEVEDSIAELLDALEEAGGQIPKKYERIHCIEMDEWVQPFFTEAAAQQYIDNNGHNLHKPFIYAEGSYRNPEWQAIRNFCIGLAREAQAK